MRYRNLMRLCTSFVIVALTLPLGGCVAAALAGGAAIGGAAGAWFGSHSDRPLPDASNRGALANGTAVVVRFATPRSLTLASRTTRETTQAAGVRMLTGRIVEQRGDTLLITPSEVNGAAGRERMGDQYVVSLPPDSAMEVQRLSRQPGRTAGLVFGMAIGFFVAVGVLLSAY